MKVEIKTYNSVSSLISSIVFLILGAVMFTNPDTVVVVVSRILGSIIVISGFISCIKNYLDVKKDGNTSSSGMISGIVLMTLGVVIILLAGVIEWLVRLVVGGWILFSGINRLIQALYVNKRTSRFFIMITISFLLIIGGLYTILQTNLAFKAIGCILMVYAVLEILGYIFNWKDKSESAVEKVVKDKDSVVEVVVIEDKTNSSKSSREK